MANDAWIEETRRYLTAKGPQLLSSLGEQIKAYERPKGKLGEILEQNGIKIRREGNGPKIYAYLDEQIDKMDTIWSEKRTPKLLPYRRAVLIAFCKILDDNSIIGLILEPRIQYRVVCSHDIPSSPIVPIECEFRHPGLDIDHMTEQERDKLQSSIKSWCLKHEIYEPSLVKEKKASCHFSNSLSLNELLKVFLEAQPEGIRRKVNIPGSLMELLIKISK